MSAQGFARRGANGTKMFWHSLKLKSKGVYSGVLTLVREGVEVFRGLDTPRFALQATCQNGLVLFY